MNIDFLNALNTAAAKIAENDALMCDVCIHHTQPGAGVAFSLVVSAYGMSKELGEDEFEIVREALVDGEPFGFDRHFDYEGDDIVCTYVEG